MAVVIDSAIIPAKNFTIFQIENPLFWKWTDDGVQLLSVQRLDVSGTIEPILDVGNYEVKFLMMIRFDAYGFQSPVNFEQKLVGGSACDDDKIKFNNPQPQILFTHPRDIPVEIPGGTFTIKEKPISGKLLFRMYEYGSHWKGGLVINSIVIRPYSQPLP